MTRHPLPTAQLPAIRPTSSFVGHGQLSVLSIAVAIGLGLGLVGAFGAARIIEAQVYGVQPFDVATLVAACALMTATGLLAIWWPARRAAARDPMEVLKEG